MVPALVTGKIAALVDVRQEKVDALVEVRQE
jgi:hypothetical protein